MLNGCEIAVLLNILSPASCVRHCTRSHQHRHKLYAHNTCYQSKMVLLSISTLRPGNKLHVVSQLLSISTLRPGNKLHVVSQLLSISTLRPGNKLHVVSQLLSISGPNILVTLCSISD